MEGVVCAAQNILQSGGVGLVARHCANRGGIL
jgi:hypothetical protein